MKSERASGNRSHDMHMRAEEPVMVLQLCWLFVKNSFSYALLWPSALSSAVMQYSPKFCTRV